MTSHQVLILEELESNGSSTVTKFISNLSEEKLIPPSTLRWNIKKLKELELIECGTYAKKGIPIKLTNMGRFIFKILKGNTDYAKNTSIS